MRRILLNLHRFLKVLYSFLILHLSRERSQFEGVITAIDYDDAQRGPDCLRR